MSGYADFRIHEFCKVFTKEMTIDQYPDVFRRSYENGITDENMKTVLGIVMREELMKLGKIQESGVDQ